jgi:predicted enzyme related to lactoylglutathione lyase
MPAKLEYFTVPVRDVAKGKAFFGELLGWEFRDEGSGYAHVTNMDAPAGGVAIGDGDAPSVWFRVDDIKAAVASVQALGGSAEEPSHSASGWSSKCVDDQGTTFNLWEAAPGLA